MNVRMSMWWMSWVNWVIWARVNVCSKKGVTKKKNKLRKRGVKSACPQKIKFLTMKKIIFFSGLAGIRTGDLPCRSQVSSPPYYAVRRHWLSLVVEIEGPTMNSSLHILNLTWVTGCDLHVLNVTWINWVRKVDSEVRWWKFRYSTYWTS